MCKRNIKKEIKEHKKISVSINNKGINQDLINADYSATEVGELKYWLDGDD